MIARLVGVLAEFDHDRALLDVQGVGYEVQISQHTGRALPAPGHPVTLQIHTHVREDQLTLFGFHSREERTLFLRLLSVAGIGPKLALTLLSGLTPHELILVVTEEDVGRLCAVPGIGKKTAERIIVELKDRLAKDAAVLHASMAGPAREGDVRQRDALAALLNLGYARHVAQQALQTVRHAPGTESAESVGALIKRALKELATRPSAA